MKMLKTISVVLSETDVEERLKKIIIDERKIRYIQFYSEYKYKGRVSSVEFFAKDIYSSSKGITPLFFGKISSNGLNTEITIRCENPGEVYSNNFTAAFILPLIFIVNLLIYFSNQSTLIKVLSTLIFVFTFILLINSRKTKQKVNVFDNFVKDIQDALS